LCQEQTKKAATFDAVWRFGGHPYVSGSDVKKSSENGLTMMESSKKRAYCGVALQNIDCYI
jgi:hypothetical protein